MIIEHEQALLKAQSEFESMLAMLKDATAQGLKLHEVEGNLWERLLRIGHLSVQSYIDAQGTCDLGATVQIEGRTLKRLDGLFDRRYVSIFGEHLPAACLLADRAGRSDSTDGLWHPADAEVGGDSAGCPIGIAG
jgi:hypothetical protein